MTFRQDSHLLEYFHSNIGKPLFALNLHELLAPDRMNETLKNDCRLLVLSNVLQLQEFILLNNLKLDRFYSNELPILVHDLQMMGSEPGFVNESGDNPRIFTLMYSTDTQFDANLRWRDYLCSVLFRAQSISSIVEFKL